MALSDSISRRAHSSYPMQPTLTCIVWEDSHQFGVLLEDTLALYHMGFHFPNVVLRKLPMESGSM